MSAIALTIAVFLLTLLICARMGSRGFLPLVVLILALPSSQEFVSLTYQSGVYWIDGATLALGLVLFVRALQSRKIGFRKNTLWLVCSIVIILVYFAIYLIGGSVEVEGLKDLRPVLFLVFVFLVANLFQVSLIARQLEFLVYFSLAAALFWSFLYYYFGLFSNDQFFNKFDFHYQGIQSYFALGFLLLAVLSPVKNEKISRLAVAAALLTVVLTSSKMLIGCMLLGLVFAIAKSIARFQTRSIFLMFVSALILLAMYSLMGGRIDELVDRGVIELVAHRIGPALPKLEELAGYKLFVGLGFGELFYIDWFVYRPNISNWSVQIDSAYVNFFVKYGLMSILIIGPVLVYLSGSGRNRNAFGLIMAASLMMITSSLFYHLAPIGLFVAHQALINRREQ